MTQESISLRADEDGNFDSPVLESLYRVWQDYDEGTVDEDTVFDVLDRIQDFVDSQLHEMDRDARSPDVDPNDPNRQSIMRGFEDHTRALNLMRDYLHGDGDHLLDEAFSLLQNATNQMAWATQSLAEHHHHSAQKACVRCSHLNEPSAGYCSSCGAVLPTQQSDPSLPTISIRESNEEAASLGTTPNFVAVADAHKAWQEGQSNDRAFFEAVDRVRSSMIAELEQLEAQQESFAQSQEPQPDWLPAAVDALEKSQLSLDAILDGLEAQDPDRVEAGFTEFAEATVSLLRIQSSS